MTRRIYVDTNILVAYHATGKKREKERRKHIIASLKVIGGLDVELVTSSWTVTEFAKAMINVKEMQAKTVNRIANNFHKNPELHGHKITLVTASPKKNFSCDDLFYGVREVMTLYNPGFGDAFQIAIMRNHSLNEILSFDKKEDFKIVPTFVVLDPLKTFGKPLKK